MPDDAVPPEQKPESKEEMLDRLHEMASRIVSNLPHTLPLLRLAFQHRREDEDFYLHYFIFYRLGHPSCVVKFSHTPQVLKSCIEIFRLIQANHRKSASMAAETLGARWHDPVAAHQALAHAFEKSRFPCGRMYAACGLYKLARRSPSPEITEDIIARFQSKLKKDRSGKVRCLLLGYLKALKNSDSTPPTIPAETPTT